MTNQSPAPVAGAVEALTALVLETKTYVNDLANRTEDDSEQNHEAAWQSALVSIDRLAALAQPAPAVAVESERELFEAKFPKPAGVEWIGDGYEVEDSYANSYACDRYIARWTTWLAARPSPPTMLNGLTEAESRWISVEDRLPDTARRVLACNPLGCVGAATYHAGHWNGIGRAHGWMELPKPLPAPPTVGSGSATEGKAK